MVPASWPDAYGTILAEFKGESSAVLGGATLSNEDLYAMHRLFRGPLGTSNIDHRFTSTLPSLADELNVVSNTIESFEREKSILVFGTSLADDLPIVFLRVRKAWYKYGAKVVVAHESETDVDSFAHTILRYKPGTGAFLAAGLAGKMTPEAVEVETGVSAADLVAAIEILTDAPTIVTRDIYNQPNAIETVASLQSRGRLNLCALKANEQAAHELRCAPISGVDLSDGKNTRQILEGCIGGAINALWIVGCNPLDEYSDRALVQRALESVDFLVVQDHTESEITAYASVVLPMTAPTETEGTYTNVERRVQRFGQVLSPKGEAKPSWRIFSELSLRITPATPMFNTSDAFDKLGSEVPAFASVKYDELHGEGVVL